LARALAADGGNSGDERSTTMRVFWGVVFVCLGLAVLSSTIVRAQKPAAGLNRGMWSGRASGPDSKLYRVTVTLDGTGAGFIEYSTIKCGGKLRFIRKNGVVYSYRETITHGQTRCGAAGQINLIANGEQLMLTRIAGNQKTSATLLSVDMPDPNDCTSCELNYDQNYEACYRISNADDRQQCQDRAQDNLQTCESACEE
jgi:hypothetical protein